MAWSSGLAAQALGAKPLEAGTPFAEPRAPALNALEHLERRNALQP